MKKNLFIMVILSALVLLVCVCKAGYDRHIEAGQAEFWKNQTHAAKEPLTIWVASDLHHISPELIENSTEFTQMMKNADGKLSEYSSEIIDAFLEAVIDKKPDMLILPGDLTFNGELRSLGELKSKLTKVQNAGIPVLVIPGNHDISSPYAADYSNDEINMTENIEENSFKVLCSELGYKYAKSADANSFSYLYELAEDVDILMLDSNTKGAPGRVSSETLKWVRNALGTENNQDQGVTISVTHQNVVAQNSFISDGFVIENSKEVQSLLEENDIKYNLSGHTHMFHEAGEKGIKDINIGSLTVSPLQYLVLNIDENREITYHKEKVDILQDEAKQRFDESTKTQVRNELKPMNIPAEDREAMLNFALELNFEYFTGKIENPSQWKSKSEWNLWQIYAKDTFWYHYLSSIIE